MNTLKEGVTLKFTRDFKFEVGPPWVVISSYSVGDTIYLIEPTGQDPHGYQNTVMADKVFWKVKTKHGVSIWSRVQRLLDIGVLEVI